MPASPPQLVLRPTAPQQNFIAPAPDVPALRLANANSVTTHSVTTPVGTEMFALGPRGELTLGENKLISGKATYPRDSTQWDPDKSAPDNWWDTIGRRAYLRSLRLAEVGDPVDLILMRWGPDGTYPDGPDGTPESLAGIPSGNSLGSIRWAGAATPQGGTPDVSGGARFRGTSASIYARAAEDLRTTATDVHALGGHLVFATCPVGGMATVDRLRVSSAGRLEVGTSFDTNLYWASSGLWKTDHALQIAGTEGLTLSGAGGKDTLALTDPSAGITAGADTNLYRTGPDAWKTDDGLEIALSLVLSGATGQISFTNENANSNVVARAQVAGDGNPRYVLRTSGSQEWGPGSGATDTRLTRSGTKTLTLDDTNSGAAALAIVGKLGINGATPPAQSADTGAAAAGDTGTQIAQHLNDLRTCLRNHGLMA